MDRRVILHLIGTLVFCGGTISAVCSVLIIMILMLSGSGGYVTAALAVYTVMAIAAGYIAARRLPPSPAARFIPPAIPAVVTVVVWTACYLISGGDGSLFSVYAASQFTHFAVIIICRITGVYWHAFVLPLAFDLMFLLFFALFERRGERRGKYVC